MCASLYPIVFIIIFCYLRCRCIRFVHSSQDAATQRYYLRAIAKILATRSLARNWKKNHFDFSNCILLLFTIRSQRQVAHNHLINCLAESMAITKFIAVRIGRHQLSLHFFDSIGIMAPCLSSVVSKFRASIRALFRRIKRRAHPIRLLKLRKTYSVTCRPRIIHLSCTFENTFYFHFDRPRHLNLINNCQCISAHVVYGTWMCAHTEWQILRAKTNIKHYITAWNRWLLPNDGCWPSRAACRTKRPK